jgi:hypothetical protein
MFVASLSQADPKRPLTFGVQKVLFGSEQKFKLRHYRAKTQIIQNVFVPRLRHGPPNG